MNLHSRDAAGPQAPDGAIIGIDIGGTFADIVMISAGGHARKAKVSASFSDPVNGIIAGVQTVLQQATSGSLSVSAVIHGTTVATNAILEKRGALTGLITTAGFRDVLELGRLRRPSSYDIFWDKPEPLVRRALRVEVDERIGHDGTVLTALDPAQVVSRIDRLVAAGVESVAVSLLHSYANPAHERMIAEILRRDYPSLHLSVSCEVLPEIKEFERTSTTVVNAYIKPAVSSYLDVFAEKLRGLGLTCPLFVMQSNGGIIDVETAKRFPVTIIESGPAAGVLATSLLARESLNDAVIALDIGGTTAKASLIEDGSTSVSAEFEVGAGLNSGSRLAKGAGYPIRIPSVDIAEVGAGGGSIAWIDPGGALQVGPRSAGAEPGPVCYGTGGTEPTVTDANVALGYMNPAALAGGRLRINRDLSLQAIQSRIAQPLELSVEEAAFGIHTIANANMIRAVRAVSTERGRDPRDFLLVAFGGAGPIHAAGMAELLDVTRIMIPPSPGLFSAIGLLFADTFRDFVKSILRPLGSLDTGNLLAEVDRLNAASSDYLANRGFGEGLREIHIGSDIRYQGQAHELSIGLALASDDLKGDLAERFGAEHERTYGYRGDDQRIELVNIRARAVGYSQKIPYKLLSQYLSTASGAAAISESERLAYFGRSNAAMPCAVLPTRLALTSDGRHGPFIVEEFDTTIVVPPGWCASLDEIGNVNMRTTRSTASF